MTGLVLDKALHTLNELNCNEFKYKKEDIVLQIVLFVIAINTFYIKRNMYLMDS
jgi:hypothetical protein